MASKTKSRQKQFADLQDKLVQDIDPELEHAPPSDSDNSDSEAEQAQAAAATDHYVSVGKSKLRGRDSALLGAQYSGSRVSRADLEAESDDDEDEEDDFEDAREELGSSASDDGSEVFDDPETADLEADHDPRDVEIDSDDAFGESDEEKFKDYTFRASKSLPKAKGKRITRPTAADFLGSDEEEQGSEDGEDEDEDEDSEEDSKRMALIDDEAEESDEDEEGEEGDLDGFIVDSDEDEEDSEDDEDGEEDGSGGDEDEDEDMDEDEEDKPKSRKSAGTGRGAIADLVSAGNKSVTVTLSEGQQKDVAKGNAIRQQRKAFDALLNIRIRLQKSLVAMNTFSLLDEPETESEEPYEAAEAAALKLWNAIDSFRSNLPGVSSDSKASGKKRKHSEATTDTTSQQIWENLEALEQRSAPRRRAVLTNWSQKANNIRTVDRTARKFSAGADKPLAVRLDEELEAPERLIKRTRTPRSCAPGQVAKKMNEDANIYDDADFYQLLLKELVDQRTADTGATGGASAAATIRFAAVREAKAKKHVDTKASKGRKMRFNVHDKLQNFMAPEDRRAWEQSAIDRLFGTLFGQKLMLEEEGEGVHEDEDMEGGVDAEEAGLRLFRS